jgi:hypothetical protein
MIEQLRSALLHAAFALGAQAILGLLTGNWWLGAALGIGWFWSREHAQRQYKLAAGTSIKKLAPWEGMDVARWNRDAILDAVAPTLAVIGVAVALA